MMVANVHMMITLKGHKPERLELLEHRTITLKGHEPERLKLLEH
jgi:hypothetical protein